MLMFFNVPALLISISINLTYILKSNFGEGQKRFSVRVSVPLIVRRYSTKRGAFNR